MDDASIRRLASIIVAAHLVVPILAGAPVAFSSRRREQLTTAGRQAARSRLAEAAATAPRLVPLTCLQCSAPVAFEGAVFSCPHCGADVRPPPEYVQTLTARAETQAELARAERSWRWSRITSARPFTALLYLCIVVWMLLVLGAAAGSSDSDWPHMVLFLAVILALVQTLVGFAGVSVLAAARTTLPALPTAQAFQCPSEHGVCRSCGGPIVIGEGRLAGMCGYCGADNYRASLVAAARRDAENTQSQAHTSLLEAVHELESRRADILAYVAFMAIAEVFYAVVLGLAALWDTVMGG